ncbi:MAG: polysaccharide biosynthesis/export family protein [Muribaculaceae bacterium]|nr:polysaccharide biosynthesis/export family protein [Muribaculaceae bacterium]
MKNILKGGIAICIATAGLMLGGCSTPKNVAYFQDLDQTVVTEVTERKAIRVQPEDKLSIVVTSKDPSLAAMFNLPIVSNRAGQSTSVSGTGTTLRTYAGNSNDGVANYTVSPEGTIDFPILGTLKIEGMTRNEVAAFIKGELMGRDLIKDPTVVVEFLNVGISIMGEVVSPGRYDLNRDNISLLDALSLAGDLTIQGKRENVLVIREEDGQMKTYRLDLTNAHQMLASPGYYLKQNDIIYVEPNGVRKRQTTVNGNTALSASFWVSVASLLTSIAVLIFK